VFFSKAGKLKNSEELYSLTIATVKKLLLIITLPMIVVAIGGEPIFRIIFGEQWAEAGSYARVFTLYVTFQFITAPIGQILAIKNKQALGFRLQIVLTVLRVGSLLIGVLYMDLLPGFLFYSLMTSIGYALFFYYSLKYSKQ